MGFEILLSSIKTILNLVENKTPENYLDAVGMLGLIHVIAAETLIELEKLEKDKAATTAC
jgi:hypothetical protein